MFDKLKKLLEGGIAQVNPFDGGKTFSTVVNNRPVQPARPQVQQQAAPQARPIVLQKVKQPSILDHLASFSKNVAEPFNQAMFGGLGREAVNIGTKVADFALPTVHTALKAANNGRPGDPAQNAADVLNKTFFPEAGTPNSLSPTRLEDYNPIQQKARLGGSIGKTATETAALQGLGKVVQGGLEAAPIVQKALQAAPRATTLATNAVKAAAEAGGGRFLGGLGGNSMFTQNGPETVRTAGTEGLKWAAAGAVTSPALSLVPNVGNIPIIRSVPRAAVGAGIGAATAPIYGMDAQQGALFGAMGGSARPINEEASTALARLNARLMGQASTGIKLPPAPTQGPKRVTPTMIDKNTSGAMGRLNALDASTPAPKGTVRVYSGGPADMPLDWSFNNPDALASFHNGRVGKGDQFRFHDVNPADLMEVPGKPGQLRLRPGAQPVNSQAVAVGMADAPYAYEGARGKVRPVSETNRLIEEGKIKPKVPNGAPIAADTAPKVKRYTDPNINIDKERANFLKSRGYTEISDGQTSVQLDDIIGGKPSPTSAYGMSHRPTQLGATADDITTIKKELTNDPSAGTIPKDFYDKPGNYMSMNDPATKESYAALKKVRGNPEGEVTIYRAGPKKQVNEGDWVTLSKEYAKREAAAEGTPVHEFKVKAKDIQFAGDSINEFGYFPQSKPKVSNIITDKTGAEIADLGGKTPKLNTDGTMTLYHRTTPEAAAEIKKSGFNIGKENTGEIFLSSSKNGQADGYGSAVVAVKVDPSKVRMDDAFNGEIHFAANAQDLQLKTAKPNNTVIAQDIPKSWLEPKPESPFSSKKYIKQQVKAQEAAASGKEPSVFSRARKEVATKGIDALSPIEKPINDAVGRDKALALRDQLDRSLRSDTIAGQFAKDNGIDEVIKGTKNVDALNQYLIARHAQTLEANGIKTGRDLAKDAQLLDQLGPEYKAHADAVTQYNQKLLDKTVEYGLISKDTAEFLKKKYPDYVPFERIFSPEELNPAKGNGAGPASLSTQSVIKRIEGSDRQIQPPLESILSKTNDVIAQGERNLAAQEVAKTMELPGNPLGLRELKAGETIGAKPTISFLENGVKRVFETTPEVAAAAKSLTRQQLGLVGKILSYPTRALRLGATGLNVGFAGANVVKDLASSFINSKNPLSSSVANPKVFLKALAAALHHNGKSYQEVVRAGAAGTSYDIGRNAAKQTVGKIRSERNVATKALYTVRHPSELVRIAEDTIGRSEEFGRALQYYGGKNAAVRKGMTQEMATKYGADAARNNTVNFARAGEYARVLNSVLPYFNAGIQGSRTFLRNVKERPAQTVSKVVLTAFMPVAATTAWNVGDSNRRAAYDDISDYEKQNNIIIVPPNPVKDKDGRWNVIKIPVSQEVANLSSIVRNGVEAMAGDANFDVAAAFGDLLGTTTSLNAGNPRQLVGQLTPQAIKPTIEALTNQNLFTGNTIVPDKMKNLDAKDQYGKYTSGTARVLGKATGISPFQIDNTIRTGFGGLGQNVVNVADKALAAAGAIKPEDVKGRPFGESIVDRFAGAQGKSSTNIVNERVKKALDALKQTPGYQELSPEERAKALNRLENDAKTANYDALDFKNGTGQYAPDYTGKKDKLSARQKGLLGDSTDISSYLKAQSGSDGKSNKDKYEEALSAYQDPNNGFTPVEKAKKTKELKRLKINADYTEDITMLHSMSKADAYQFLSTFDDGNKYAKQLLAYDDALTKAGLQAKNKFRDKYGNEAIKPQEKGSGGGRGGKGKSAADKTAFVRSTYSKLGKLLTNSNAKITYNSPSGSKVAIRTKLKKAKTS